MNAKLVPAVELSPMAMNGPFKAFRTFGAFRNVSRKRRVGPPTVPADVSPKVLSRGLVPAQARARRRDCEGAISGYVLKLIRESIGLTQESLARQLQVD